MLLRLADHLDVPLRERNELLNAAGFAAVFTEQPLAGSGFEIVRNAINAVLKGHEPYPAFAVDRHWTLVGTNGGFRPFLGGIDEALITPPVNVLRLTLNPRGLGKKVANYQQWRSHVLENLRRQIAKSNDPFLIELSNEIRAYAPPHMSAAGEPPAHEEWHRLVVPFQLMTESGTLSFYSTSTVFGTPLDITLAEISIESFYPADTATASVLHALASDRRTENLPPR